MVFVGGETCPDCAVAPGCRHEKGCDVARCKICGFQDLSCEHRATPMTMWTGRWPGDLEVSEGLASDLAELYVRRLRGELVWNIEDERWMLAGHRG